MNHIEKALKEKYLVTESDEGKRLDVYLTQFSEKNRSYIKKLIDEGHVTVNENIVKAGYALNIDDVVQIVYPEIKRIGLKPVDLKLDIVYEDKDLIAVNKPPFMAVHAGVGESHREDSLVNGLLFHCKDLSSINDKIRPGIVHRLDKNTSGLMVAAKNQMSNEGMLKVFKERKIKKTYLALIVGHLIPTNGTIDSPIGRDSSNRKKMAVVINGGKEAVTKYRVIEYIDEYSLLEVQPLTGRTHQIRVHMAAIGHPIVGDVDYGYKKVNFKMNKLCGLKRQFLHAKQLEFDHPITGQHLNLEADLSPDLKETLDKLKQIS
jgi:23S rRNA pseudouridine1911/1915/1917 synthase